MAWGTSDLKRQLSKIREVSPSPPVNVYLEAVYRLCSSMTKTDVRRKRIRAMAPGGIKSNLVRRTIELTTGSHVTSKMKGKYANTLHWAKVNGVSPKSLDAFIARNDGINGCDTKYRAHVRRKKEGTLDW